MNYWSVGPQTLGKSVLGEKKDKERKKKGGEEKKVEGRNFKDRALQEGLDPKNFVYFSLNISHGHTEIGYKEEIISLFSDSEVSNYPLLKKVKIKNSQHSAGCFKFSFSAVKSKFEA